MEPQETIVKTDTGVKIIEMQPVVKAEYTNEQIQQEHDSVVSELKNFKVICENRKAYLEKRLVELIEYVAKSKGVVEENIINNK